MEGAGGCVYEFDGAGHTAAHDVFLRDACFAKGGDGTVAKCVSHSRIPICCDDMAGEYFRIIDVRKLYLLTIGIQYCRHSFNVLYILFLYNIIRYYSDISK